MHPRLFEIPRENEKDRQIIVEALARIAGRDSEYAVIFEALKIEVSPKELTFLDGGEIDWITGRAAFSPATYRLLRELWESEKKFISKEEVREYVQHDDESKNGSIRVCICTARKELDNSMFPYTIVTVRATGYKLEKALANVSENISKRGKRPNGC